MAYFVKRRNYLSGILIGVLLFGLIACIVAVLFPKEWLCLTEVSLMELVGNLSSAYSIKCHTLGTRLGYGHNELDAMADVGELVETWSHDRLSSGPKFGHGSLFEVLNSEEYHICPHEVMALHIFEECSDFVYTLSSVALYGILVFLFMIGVMIIWCQPSCCSRNPNDTIWSRVVHERQNRVRSDSEKTDPGPEAPGILIKNPIFTENVTLNVVEPVLVGKKKKKGATLQFLSCIFSDGEKEEVNISSGLREENPKPPNRLFKKDVDGTLSRISVPKVCEAMQSVGILFAWESARGTVIRIGDHCVMTAWHVIKDIVVPPHSLQPSHQLQKERLALSEIYVDFHEYTRQSPTIMHFKLLPIIVFLDAVLDIVILELDVAGKEYIPPPIQFFSDVFQLNSGENQIKCVHIIGQHPIQENVVVDFGCKVINQDDKNVKKARKWMKNHMNDLRKTAKQCNENPNDVDTAYFDVFDTQRRLIFNTFLEFGSSGGAVIALLPEGQVALVAVVIHGLPPNYWYSASTHKFPESMRMEVGCTIKAVLQSMEWKGSEALRDQLFARQSSNQEVDESEPMETDGGPSPTHQSVSMDIS